MTGSGVEPPEMDLFEHQGKDLFRAAGIQVPRGIVAEAAEEAADATRELGGRSVVKVQVQAGGRGKGGGVVLVDSPERAAEEAGRMLRDGFGGRPVTRILVEEILPIAREFYASILLDRSAGDYLAMMTAEGGVDVEELARTRPEALRRVHVDALLSLRGYHLRDLTGVLPRDAREGATEVLRGLWRLLGERDATLVEINPLVQLEDGRVVALDAKVTIDDNALARQPDLQELRGAFPIDPVEARAEEAGLQYVKLDGDVGIIGNGAGLVMSTLDVVAQAGGKAANFLDIGGGASADTMATSLQVILSDPAVKAVLVNIFGGITRGDLVAQGILDALERVEATVPIVVRLDGTNAEEGRRILTRAAHPRIVSAATMIGAAEEAARRAETRA
jgi:succinyl-CoA synthetase beta subunit